MINRLRECFTQVANEVLNNQNLSLKAKWLYAFLCSKPDNWNFSYNGLTSQLQEWVEAIRWAVKELVSAWVLIRIAKRNSDWTMWGWEWIINPTTEDKKHTDPTQKHTEVRETRSTENVQDISNNKISNNYIKEISEQIEEKYPENWAAKIFLLTLIREWRIKNFTIDDISHCIEYMRKEWASMKLWVEKAREKLEDLAEWLINTKKWKERVITSTKNITLLFKKCSKTWTSSTK
jgi:hypothetical protein